MPISSFTARGKAADGRSYRVEWNGGGTEVQPIMPFLLIGGGEDEDVGLDPIWPRSLRLFLKDVDLEPLFGLGEQAVPVEAYELSGGSDTLAYKGFMATNFYSDVPWSQNDTVEIRALDGLGTLKNSTLDELPFAGNDYVPLTEAIARILGNLYGLEVEFGAHWYPDAGGVLASSDCPLAQVGFDPDNYRQDRPEGSWWSQLEVLKDLCKEQGLIIKQVERPGGARWLVAQRDAYESDGSLKVWRYDAAGAELSGQPVTLDRKKTLAYDGADFVDEGGRDFVRRRKSVTVTHDHMPIDNLIGNPGFENGGQEWSDISAHPRIAAKVEDITNLNIWPGPQASSEDSKALFSNTNTIDQTTTLVPVAKQSLGRINEPPPNTALRLSAELGGFDFTVHADVKLQVGSYWLTRFTTTINDTTLPGETKIAVDPLDRPIPAGTSVPIINPDKVDGDIVTPSGEFTVTERSPKGADRLVGEASVKVPEAGWQIWHVGFGATETSVNLLPFNPTYNLDNYSASDGFYFESEVVASLVQSNGDPISGGAELTLLQWTDTSDRIHFWNNFQAAVVAGGQPLESTLTRAFVPEFGEAEAQTVRTSSGPTSENLARLRGIDPNGDSFAPTEWGVGPGHGSALSLAELKAQQRERYFSTNLKTLTLRSWRDAEYLVGDELVELDGGLYTIHSITYDAQEGGAEVTLIEWADQGTSDITIQTVLEQSGSGPAGGGGAPAVGGGGGVTTWDGLGGTLSGDVPFETVDQNGDPVSRGAAFSGDLDSGPTICWDRDPTGSSATDRYALRVRDEANGQTLLTLDEDGNLVAAGDVSAFGSSSGGSGGGSSEFQAGRSLTLDTGTDPSTLNVNLVGGTNVNVSTDGSDEYVIDVPDAGAVDSVFGRTGAVTPQSGDYTHDQIGGISSDDHHAKTTSAADLTDVSPDSTSDAHHSKTTSASELTDVSADNVSDAHHTRPSAGDGLSESANTFTVNESQVDHDALSGFVGDEHVDHSGVSINAGTALSGGGDLTSSRTLDVTGPLTGISFKTAGDDLEWQADANNDLILQNTTDGQKLLTIDQDTGDLIAEGDVSAFGSSSGSGGGGTTFTSTEVSNLRSGALDDGSTPWTSNNFYDDSDARGAINSDPNHGSTAQHDYFTDADAVDAVESHGDLNITGNLTLGANNWIKLEEDSGDERFAFNDGFNHPIVLRNMQGARINTYTLETQIVEVRVQY